MSELGPSPLAPAEPQLSVVDAQAAIAAALRPAVRGSETVTLADALGRVLAADLVSPIDVPAHDNSAMDGYAFDGALLRNDGATTLHIAGTAYAGRPFDGAVAAGDCVRIMTGAVMPAGTDTVVPQELCLAEADRVHIEPRTVRAGENRRLRAEDLARGRAALHAGRVLNPADLGLAASLGVTRLEVRQRLRVALFSTGDELRAPGQPLDAGSIYDSNRASLHAALSRLGVEVLDLGLVRDDPVALKATLHSAVTEADAVLTSGGVSVGEADYTREVIAEAGQIAFWKVAMRPGRPFAFGALHGPDGHARWLFALPGNPVAALIAFYVFARGALLQLAGATAEPLPLLQARSTAAIRKRPGRTEYQRGRVTRAPDGRWQVQVAESQGSGVLRSMSEANAIVVLGHDQGSVAAGDPVDVWLFDGLA